MPRYFTNGIIQVGTGSYLTLGGGEIIPADTGLPSPGSVGVTVNQLAQFANAGVFTKGVYGVDTATTSFTAGVSEVAGAGLVVLNLTGALAAGANVTTPAASDLIGDFPIAPLVGMSWVWRILNNSSGAFAWTVVAGAGVTLGGTATIGQNTWREFLFTVTGSAAVSLQNIGSGSN